MENWGLGGIPQQAENVQHYLSLLILIITTKLTQASANDKGVTNGTGLKEKSE